MRQAEHLPENFYSGKSARTLFVPDTDRPKPLAATMQIHGKPLFLEVSTQKGTSRPGTVSTQRVLVDRVLHGHVT
jgi:hypothetical protein